MQIGCVWKNTFMRSDLGILVCRIRALDNFKISNQMGEAVQQLCINSVAQINKALATELDRSGVSDAKPYSVSGIFGLDLFDELHGNIKTGDTAWLQICGLRADITDALDRFFIARRPTEIEIDRHPWSLEHAEWIQHTTYRALLSQAKQDNPPERVTFEFITPVSFRSKGMDLPLPTPRNLFTSLERALRGMTGYQIPLEFNAFLDYFLVVEDYELVTKKRYLQDTLHTGFVGKIQYGLLKHNDYVAKDARRSPEAKALRNFLRKNKTARLELARAVGLLREFATYAGVGKKTTQGMGVVRLD